ncbi:MAG TPA: class I SAM-dependent methyltransferase [Pseudomonas sp.]|nr:class I SAM-dependent methyltransferase [Pseudomonas sp.]
MNHLLFTLRLTPLQGLAGREPHILLAGEHQLELLKRLDNRSSGRRRSLRIRFADQDSTLETLATDSVDLAVIEARGVDCIGQLVRVARKGILVRR